MFVEQLVQIWVVLGEAGGYNAAVQLGDIALDGMAERRIKPQAVAVSIPATPRYLHLRLHINQLVVVTSIF